MEVVKEPLVHLNPNPTLRDFDNMLYGLDLLWVKTRLFADFHHIIEGYDTNAQNAIFGNHLCEINRYLGKAPLVGTPRAICQTTRKATSSEVA